MDAAPRRAAALAGVASVVFGLGAAHLAAGVVGPASSPVVAIANRVVDLTPTPLKEWAVSTLGTADKLVLVVGIVVVTAGLGSLVGLLGRGRPAAGIAAGGVLAAVALLAAGLEPARGGAWWLPALVAWAAGSWGLTFLLRRASSRNLEGARQPASGTDRRDVLRLGAGGLLAGFLGQVYGSGGPSTAPPPPLPTVTDAAASPLPAGLEAQVGGLSPFVTPASDLYRIDTAFTLPKLDTASWRLTIDGMVEAEISLGWDDLLAMDAVTRSVTLACVSNEIGGGLIGSGQWRGVRTAELLKRAGVRDGADMVLSTSSDGFTVSTPLQALLDDRDALVCYAMNGAPLLQEHGFPVRLLTPGLYGFVGATKWLTRMTVTTFAATQAYWTQRGWAPEAPMKRGSRIEVPRAGDQLAAGTIKVGGTAWAPRVGVGSVQVRVDGGPWAEATLGPDAGIDYWRQWLWSWDAPAGEHTLQVRVIDSQGVEQTDRIASPFPDGASGYHSVKVTIS